MAQIIAVFMAIEYSAFLLSVEFNLTLLTSFFFEPKVQVTMIKKIDIRFFNTLGEGHLKCIGLGTFQCQGMPGLAYPRELMIDPIQPGVKVHPYYSRSYSCPPNDNPAGQCIMNYAILIWGQQGVYIHEWPTTPTYAGNGNRGTHGCIHLRVGEAAQVYHWVDTKTYVTITRPW